MNLLDENIRDDQRMLLRRWRIPFRQVGKEISRAGTQDQTLKCSKAKTLHRLKRATLFTQDEGWFKMVVTEILDTALESARTGKRIDLPAQLGPRQ